MKYRSIVEAFQMTDERLANNENWPSWLHEAWQRDPYDANCVFRNWDGRTVSVTTGRRPALVERDGWIVCTARGDLLTYSLKVFAETYEPIPEES
jgi:NADH:ubiquinone oxidoreductase subunit